MWLESTELGLASRSTRKHKTYLRSRNQSVSKHNEVSSDVKCPITKSTQAEVRNHLPGAE